MKFVESTAIVGNGPCETGVGKGAAIDAFDVVCRFNNFVTVRFEKDYGSKVTHWVSFLGGPLKPDGPCQVNNRSENFAGVLIPFPEWSDLLPCGLSRKNPALVARYANRIEHIPGTIWKDLKRYHKGSPTTGFAFLWWYYREMGFLRRTQTFGFNFWHGEKQLEYFSSEMPLKKVRELLMHPHYRNGNIERNLFERIVT